MQMETSENGSMPKSWTHHVKRCSIDNSSTFKNGCDNYFKSKSLKDDYSSTGGNNGLCYGSRPSSLLMQNPQTMKITRIFRGVYLLCIAIRASTTLGFYKGEKIISQHLKLEELSERLRCFCSHWPPNFEFDKDKCIQLWVAQGFFDFEFGRRIEVVANEYFKDMVNKDFIVQSGFDIAKERMMYKVVSSDSLLRSSWVQEDKLTSITNEVQHLFLITQKKEGDCFKTLVKLRQLRTLILFNHNGNSIKYIPYGFKLPHLRILDLRGTRIFSLPESIGDILSLRYLDVSGTRILCLPETIGNLRYLQILKLQRCCNFYELPKCTNKLINLRHLDLDIVCQLTSMPVGMGNLTSLQTLKGFIVGKDEGYRVGELKHLNDLNGSLWISRLDLISSVEEAREVEMYKKRLTKLDLTWEQNTVNDFDLVEDILECLEPHLSLKELTVSYYCGSRFPTWMSCLPNILSITLRVSTNCSYLPSLGGLQSLKNLKIYEMHEVRCIDHHFCRYWGSQIGGVAAFPKLEKLTIVGMPKLESWTGVEDGDFPCLLELTASTCPKLVEIPMISSFTTLNTLSILMCRELQSLSKGKLPSKLQHFEISNCPLVTKRCLKPQGEDWFKIKHIPSIYIDGYDVTPKPKYGSRQLK
ncbi:hypothetical protein EJD97_020778 [Solanum chilense]|uniref:NB-ARC domain-containing protein n=1 Tax=Solanum chilense TaxID=4083 RepID=A0A6N2C4M7_SOLCI|nr:hypothetical protein EJD97_020778 [Solanum chilense]